MLDEPVDVTDVEEELEKELEDEIDSEDLKEELESRASEDEEAVEELEPEEEEPEDEGEDEESEFVEAKERAGRREREEVEEEDIVEERFYTIPLKKAWIYPRKKRTPKAARIVKSFVLKHMKVRTEVEDEEEEPEKLVVSNEVNELLWSRGIEKPPRKIRVRVVRDKEGVVTVLPAEGE